MSALNTRRATFTVAELMELLGLGRAAVYLALRQGIIPSVRIGRRFVVPRSAVEEWLRAAKDNNYLAAREWGGE